MQTKTFPRPLVVLALLLALGGCGSTLRSPGDLGLQEPVVEFLDLYYQGFTPGPVNPVVTITVVLGIENPNSVPVTVEKVDMNVRGSPELRHEQRTHPVGIKMEPGQKIRVPLNLLSTLVGVRTTTYYMPPLYLTAKVLYSTDAGRFQSAYTRSMAASERRTKDPAGSSEDDDEDDE